MKRLGGKKSGNKSLYPPSRQNRVMMGVPGVFVWLSYIWRAIWEVVFSGTAIFLSFSHTHKFNLHFLRRHVAQIEYSKKVWKNDFSAASWHSHLRGYFAVSFCRGTMGWRGSAAGAVVEGKKKEKDWKKSRGWLSTGWFHLVSSDSHRRQAQSLPLSHWAAGGHVLNQQG